jgi:hypothetical protein
VTGATRQAVAAYVRGNPGATPAQVATATGLGWEAIKKTLQRLASAGTLRTDGRGHYYAGGRRHLSPVPPAGDSDGDAGPSRTASLPALVSPRPAEAAPGVPDGEHGDSSPAGRWVCSWCSWRQARPEVLACEFCGWPRSRTVPR